MSGVTAHLEIASNDSRAHPISETGYKSHFCPRELVDEAGGPGRLCDCVARDGR